MGPDAHRHRLPRPHRHQGRSGRAGGRDFRRLQHRRLRQPRDVKHRLGFETWYAHLSTETSYVGEPVVGGTRVGLVGSTGHSTGPHLHFEVRHNGVPIDPMPRMLATAAGASARLVPSVGPPLAPACDRRGLHTKRRPERARWPSRVC